MWSACTGPCTRQGFRSTRGLSLARAFADPDLRPVRNALLIDGLDVLDPTTYDCMAETEAAAKRPRYLELD